MQCHKRHTLCSFNYISVVSIKKVRYNPKLYILDVEYVWYFYEFRFYLYTDLQTYLPIKIFFMQGKEHMYEASSRNSMEKYS